MLVSLALASAALPAVFPLPTRFTPGDGVFHGVAQLRFEGVGGSNDRNWLRQSLRRLLPGKPGSDPLILRIDPKIKGEEAYELKIARHEIIASARSAKGLYWSLQTLRQLRTAEGFPCATIVDAPKFPWRGVLLDEGRHFMGVASAKRLLDVMSLYKFNVLHWHLTEDQGWRVEIKSHPLLTKIGAWRKEADGSTTGGFYTQDEIKEIVAYAASRNIVVVPEIEMPGHSSAAIASYPILGCTKQQIAVPATWGVFQDVYCAGRESTFKFLEDVLSEVIPLFPSRYIHIGGDEVPKQHWHACPDCQARIKSEGLKDEHELQSYFVRRIQKFLTSRGKTLVGWDEIMQGGLAKGAIVQVWNDQKLAAKAIDEGNSVVLSPQSYCYLNQPAERLPLKRVYSYDPTQDVSAPTKIKGLETTLWSEGITTSNLLARFLPRGLAMSEIFWSNPPKDFPAFEERLHRHETFMKGNRIDFGPADTAMLSYKVRSEPEAQKCVFEGKIGLAGARLRYSVDGVKGVSSSSITWPLGKTLRVALSRNGKDIEPPIVIETIKSLAYGKRVKLLTAPAASYDRAGAQGLVDGLLGSNDFHDGLWLGWNGVDAAATVDLGKEAPVREIGLHCLQQMRSWIMMPRSVVFETSLDEIEWRPFGEVANTVKDTEESEVISWFTASKPSTVTARFVRIRALNYGKLPSWHNGAGESSFIFADELVVR